MPNRRSDDPLDAFNFAIEIEGVTQGPVLAVDLLETSTAVMEHKRGNDILARATPGRHHYGRIVVRRAYTDNDELWQWRRAVSDGKLERKAGSIILLDGTCKEVTRFNFFEAWPCRWRLSAFDANTDGYLVEEIEIVCEKIEKG
jgi:phage tail-like protein